MRDEQPHSIYYVTHKDHTMWIKHSTYPTKWEADSMFKAIGLYCLGQRNMMVIRGEAEGIPAKFGIYKNPRCYG